MRTFIVILSSFYVVFAHYEGPLPFQKRFKRDAVGALDIVTNNAQPIHADVKNENMVGENDVTTSSSSTTEKPCPKSYVPSSIEMGTVFQVTDYLMLESSFQLPEVNGTAAVGGQISTVTPPKDVTTISEQYPVKSLRKSWPLTGRLDLIRSVSRVVTLSVMIITAVLEFYPLVQHLYSISAY